MLPYKFGLFGHQSTLSSTILSSDVVTSSLRNRTAARCGKRFG